MPRVNHVKAARGRANGEPRRCAGCGKEINPGDSYKWFKIKLAYGGIRKNYCSTCTIRPSAMTNSVHRQAILMAQEAAEDALAQEGQTLADIAQILRDYGSTCTDEIAEGYRESAQNIEDGFGHPTYQSDELTEQADAWEAFGQECDAEADEIESLEDPDDDDAVKQAVLDENDEFDDGEQLEAAIEEKRGEWRDQAIDRVNDKLGEEPM